jgi:two-component system chemotaxis sensor kinase CheA
VPTTDDKLLRRLLVTFRTEAQEHIETITSGLLELERVEAGAAQAAVLDTTFRAAHSLKGAARAVNVKDIETLCQSLESVFAALKRTEMAPSAELFDLLHQVADTLGKSLQAIDVPVDRDVTAAQRPDITHLVSSLRTAVTEKRQSAAADSTRESPSAPAATAAEFAQLVATGRIATDGASAHKHEAPGTIRVAANKLDAVLLQTEELLSAKLAATQQALRLRQYQAGSAEWQKMWAKLRPDLRILRQALDGKCNGRGNRNGNGSAAVPARAQCKRVVDFLEWNQNFIEALDARLVDLAKAAAHEQRSLGTMVDNLLDDMKKVVMQPFSALLDVVPRLVRDLCREQGKKVEFVMRGEAVEIDRRILEQMKDPLVHLVRNCLDHGIEPPQLRMQQGKPAQATLSIEVATRNGSNVELLITDDGRGIDVAVVKASAMKLGLLPPARAATLSDQEALFLVFQSGVSTSPIITDISGRGLGLAIVKENVEKLNGTLSVETQLGKGTRFRIILPLTVARFRGTLVRLGEHLFVLPTSNVERAVRVTKQDIQTVENRETIVLDGRATALLQLAAVLELPRPAATDKGTEMQLAIVLTSGNQRIACVVDEVLNEQEVLVKSLGKQLARVRNIAGATVLGNGKVAPILNVSDLMKSAARIDQAGIGHLSIGMAAVAAADSRQQSVLVAEDSITSRILLKNILETAGYQVETAVDGIDALMKLRSGAFDLVVSDVEMPRLNGFGLTAKVRADKRLTELPVVLVTALDSREDREQGIDVGANAYIVKGSFDQSNLLDVIRRLI